jgi:hypothetical protein
MEDSVPETLSSVLLVIAFVMPGFISSFVINLALPRQEPPEGRLILEGITLSSANHGLLSLLYILAWKLRWYEDATWLAVLAFGSLFIAPLLLGLGLSRFLDSYLFKEIRNKFGLAHPVPKAWDRFFRQGKPCWVVATLKDGVVVAGLYGHNSFASSFPAEEDIYLEKLCELSPEGKILRLSPRGLGAIIRMNEVSLLEFIELEGM